MKKNRNDSFNQAPLIGGSSLLVIFAVLCLTVFALLTLSTALAEKRLSDASAARALDYREAAYAGQEILARLRAGEMPEGVTVSGDSLSYSVPVTELLELRVETRIGEDGSFEILKIHTAPAGGSWEPDDSLEVWDGFPADGPSGGFAAPPF